MSNYYIRYHNEIAILYKGNKEIKKSKDLLKLLKELKRIKNGKTNIS